MANDKIGMGIAPLTMDQHIPHDRYVVDDSDKFLALWQKRIAIFFPDMIKHVVEYRLRYITRDKRIFYRGCIMLMDDGSLKEFTYNKESGSAEVKTTYDPHANVA